MDTSKLQYKLSAGGKAGCLEGHSSLGSTLEVRTEGSEAAARCRTPLDSRAQTGLTATRSCQTASRWQKQRTASCHMPTARVTIGCSSSPGHSCGRLAVEGEHIEDAEVGLERAHGGALCVGSALPNGDQATNSCMPGTKLNHGHERRLHQSGMQPSTSTMVPVTRRASKGERGALQLLSQNGYGTGYICIYIYIYIYRPKTIITNMYFHLDIRSIRIHIRFMEVIKQHKVRF